MNFHPRCSNVNIALSHLMYLLLLLNLLLLVQGLKHCSRLSYDAGTMREVDCCVLLVGRLQFRSLSNRRRVTADVLPGYQSGIYLDMGAMDMKTTSNCG
jgi:hypothetical protein